MKKTLLSLTFASVFMAGIAQAEDHSAVVDISGALTGDNSECTVTTDLSSLDLSAEIVDLPEQGASSNDRAATLNYSVEPGCYNRIAFEFHGVTDETGTVLANTEPTESAAKGVGIGLFDSSRNSVDINQRFTPHHDDKFFVELVKLKGQSPVEGSVYGALTIDIVRL